MSSGSGAGAGFGAAAGLGASDAGVSAGFACLTGFGAAGGFGAGAAPDSGSALGPDFGGATIYTNVRAGYTADCPNVGKLLANQRFTLAMENEIMGAILDKGEDPDKAAKAWLKAHPQMWESWIAGVTTLHGHSAKEAVEKHLGG